MIQPVAVKVYSALTHIAVVDLHPIVLRGIDITEYTEALVIHSLELYTRVLLGSCNILAEGVNENIGLSYYGLHLIGPFLDIQRMFICVAAAVTEVRIAVRRYSPALLFDRLGNSLGLFDFFVILICREPFSSILWEFSSSSMQTKRV